jgi:hypothetical protein
LPGVGPNMPRSILSGSSPFWAGGEPPRLITRDLGTAGAREEAGEHDSREAGVRGRPEHLPTMRHWFKRLSTRSRSWLEAHLGDGVPKAVNTISGVRPDHVK